MSTMFSDIKARLSTAKQKEPLEGIIFAEILYADDTLIFGDHTPSIKKLFKKIEVESSYYNMELNYRKCINMTTNRKTSTIKYLDGTKVPRDSRAVYLGSLLTDTVSNTAEINNRTAMTMRTFKQLKIFWDKADTTTNWKLRTIKTYVQPGSDPTHSK